MGLAAGALPSLCSGRRPGAVPRHSRHVNFSCVFSPENVFTLLDLAETRALGGKQMTRPRRLCGGRSRHCTASGVRGTAREGWVCGRSGHTRPASTGLRFVKSVVASGGAVMGLVLLGGDVSPGLFGATLGGCTPQKHLLWRPLHSRQTRSISECQSSCREAGPLGGRVAG